MIFSFFFADDISIFLSFFHFLLLYIFLSLLVFHVLYYIIFIIVYRHISLMPLLPLIISLAILIFLFFIFYFHYYAYARHIDIYIAIAMPDWFLRFQPYYWCRCWLFSADAGAIIFALLMMLMLSFRHFEMPILFDVIIIDAIDIIIYFYAFAILFSLLILDYFHLLFSMLYLLPLLIIFSFSHIFAIIKVVARWWLRHL